MTRMRAEGFVFTLSAGVLLLQLVQTRIFSVIFGITSYISLYPLLFWDSA